MRRSYASRNFAFMRTPDYLSVTQAADELRVAPRTLQHWIKTGKIAAEKLDPDKRTSAYVIPRAEVERVKAEAAA